MGDKAWGRRTWTQQDWEGAGGKQGQAARIPGSRLRSVTLKTP